MIKVRKAGDLDARGMAELLNGIIRKGVTTAFTQEVTGKTLKGWFRQAPDQSAWHVAEDERGTLLGFQSIEPHKDLPSEACDIATFVALGQTGLGIGSELFEASKQVAIGLGYNWINATIRADNEGGLAYYQSRGFEDYDLRPNQKLANGLIVSKISKRYDLF